jgi:hypothetical protein
MTNEDPIPAFPDESLKLCVIDELRSLGLLPPFDLKAYRAANPADPADFEDDLEDLGIAPEDASQEDLGELRDHEPDWGVQYELVATPISKAMAKAVRQIITNAIYEHPTVHDIWPQWDGESGEFDIESLEGIEVLENLEKLSLTVRAEIKTLEPLTRLPALRIFELTQNPLPPLEPLLRCPALNQVRLRFAAEKQGDVLGALRARGVEVALE